MYYCKVLMLNIKVKPFSTSTNYMLNDIKSFFNSRSETNQHKGKYVFLVYICLYFI